MKPNRLADFLTIGGFVCILVLGGMGMGWVWATDKSNAGLACLMALALGAMILGSIIDWAFQKGKAWIKE